MSTPHSPRTRNEWLWFWLAGLLWHLGLSKQYRYAQYRASGLTPKQISIRLLRSQLNRAEKLRILWRDKFVCHICHKRGWWQDMEVDHVIALANGGGNQEWNKKAAHRHCNRKKGAQSSERTLVCVGG